LGSGTSGLGGQIRELRAPKESKSETPKLIAPRGDGGFSSYLAKKFFDPSSIYWHMRNFPKGVPSPQNLAPKSDQFSALPQTRLQCPHEKFSPRRIFRGSSPLSNDEEGVQKSAPKPEIGEKIFRGVFWGPPNCGRTRMPYDADYRPWREVSKNTKLVGGGPPIFEKFGVKFFAFLPHISFSKGFFGAK